MSTLELVPWCLAFAVVAVLIICGNILTIVVLLKSSLINTNLCALLISLAAADLTVGALAVPLYIYQILAGYLGYRHYVTSGTIYQAIDIFTAYASIFSLIVIAGERLLAIGWSIRHQQVSKGTYLTVIAIVWGLAAILGCLAVLKNMRIITLVSFFIPVVVFFFLGTAILCASYLTLWCIAREIRSDEDGGTREQEKRLGFTLLIVTILFIVMWFPFKVVNMVFFAGVKCGLHCTTEVSALVKLLHYGNSFVNPIIYTFRVPGFKRVALRILRRETLASVTEEDITMNMITGPVSETQ